MNIFTKSTHSMHEMQTHMKMAMLLLATVKTWNIFKISVLVTIETSLMVCVC